MVEQTPTTVGEQNAFQSIFVVLRNRVLSGFLLALPIFLTFVIIIWVYRRIVSWILGPIYVRVVEFLRAREEAAAQAGADNNPDADAGALGPTELPIWIEFVAAPILTVAIFISILFLLGMFFKSRLHRALDWFLLQVPFVNWVYSVILKVVNTLQTGEDGAKKFKRVVLVKFPHAGMKAPAFVTGSCIDDSTGKTILCVYVPTTPVPTSGYMLLVPEDEVTELDWDLQETLEAIVSGGVTAPDRVTYWNPAAGDSVKPIGTVNL